MSLKAERRCAIAAIVSCFLLVIIVLGEVEFHNELERDIHENTFLGYIDDDIYTGKILFDEDDFPVWIREVSPVEQQTVCIKEGSSSRVGMYADVVYYENRMEERKWFSGKLKNREQEHYYKIEGKIYLKPADGHEKTTIKFSELKPSDYDYTTFRGAEKP